MGFKDSFQAMVYNTKHGIIEHSPEIFMVSGFIFLGLTVYAVRKAAKKEDEYLAPVKEELKALKEQPPSKENSIATAKAFTKCVGRVARLYGWSMLAIGACGGSFALAKKKMNDKLLDMTGACSFLLGKLNQEKGEGEEEPETKMAPLSFQDEESGDEPTKYIQDKYGPFAMFFDCSSGRYVDEYQINWKTAISAQAQLNEKIKARARWSPSGRGFLYIEDVHEELNIPYTSGDEVRAAKVNGWIYDLEKAKELGENYMVIDIGLKQDFNLRARERHEPVIIISPQNAGPVYYNIKKLDYCTF